MFDGMLQIYLIHVHINQSDLSVQRFKLKMVVLLTSQFTLYRDK